VPTIDELVDEFRVARVTVRQAMDILAAEGLIERHRGRGTFVARTPDDTRHLQLGTSLAALSTMYEGSDPTLLTLAETIAAPPLAPSDGIPADRYRYMRRVHSRGDTPYVLIDIYLAADVFRRAPKRFRTEIVIPLLRSLPGIEIARAWQRLRIDAADVETARHLEVPVNSPVAEVRRVFCDANGRVIYFAEAIYRGDYIHLEIDLLP